MRIETPKFYLPRTGQTASYAAGDDGDVRAGNPRATRFVDNGNGTISDRATGLQWVQDPSQFGGVWGTPGTPAVMNWADAITNCNALDHGGFTDWRLPNMLELFSLVDWSVASGSLAAIDPVFTNVRVWDSTYFSRYWSSTTWATSPYAAFHVSFRSDYSTRCYHTGKTSANCYVRPVRGGRING